MPLKPDIRSHEPSSLVFRTCIGGMALLFLTIIIFGNMIVTGSGILDAISAYYYSPMRNFFIGSLCVIGTLLICYRYQRVDKIAGIIAGLCVIGLAICPRDPGKTATWIGRAHWAFSIGFLLTLLFMVFYLFTLSDNKPSLIQHKRNWVHTTVYIVRRPFWRSDQKTLPPGKFWRNWVYIVCSGIMAVFLVLCLLDQLFFSSNKQIESINPVFWCELFPLLAFSVAWFVKGVGILQDKSLQAPLAPKVKSPNVAGDSISISGVKGVSSTLGTE